MAGLPSTPKEFEAALRTLRDVPIPTGGAHDKILAPTWTFVMNAPGRDSEEVVHWFCLRADPTVREAATFIIRLFAYNNAKVEAWKERLRRLLHRCSECTKRLQDAKLETKRTYFAAFQPAILDNFWRTFCDWEVKILLEALLKANIQPNDVTPTLLDAPPGVLYHVLSNPAIFNHGRIRPFVTSIRAAPQNSQLLLSPPPVGLLYLAVDEDEGPRTWARELWKLTTVMTAESFSEPYKLALKDIADTLEQQQAPTSYITADSTTVWSGFAKIIRRLPLECLTLTGDGTVDICRLITGHLHDQRSYFANVLKSLMYVLTRLGDTFWDVQDPSIPHKVFDAVKDNDEYLRLLQEAADELWPQKWFGTYLGSFAKLPIWNEVFTKVMTLLCDEAQHERFCNVRPQLMAIAAELLSDIMEGKTAKLDAPREKAITSALSAHKDRLAAIAFSRSYESEQWKVARAATRTFIKTVLVNDLRAIAESTTELSKLAVKEGSLGSVPVMHEQLWRAVNDNVHSQDEDAITMLIHLTASYAHTDILTVAAYQPAFGRHKEARTVFDAINKSIETARSGFRDAVVQFADGNGSSRIASMLQRPLLARDVVFLLMSPCEDLQVAGQALISQAYDVDGRAECFRALLESLPDETLRGIRSVVVRFNDYIPLIPEGCSSAKSLVRCLTDVIDALCSRSDGLLRNNAQQLRSKDRKINPTAHLPVLWSLMSQAIAIIFRGTPGWSAYFPSEEMIIWMRDALIFGRDMLSQRAVIESAILSANSEVTVGTKKLSQTGKQMVTDLQRVLPELVRWLRLTDFELLHQSFSLLETLLDCFRSTKIDPDPAVLEKLNKHVASARRGDGPTTKTHLDATRIARLEEMLADFDDEPIIIEPEIIVVAQKPAQPPKKAQISSLKPYPPIKAGQPLKQSKPSSRLMQETRLAAKAQASGASKFSASSSTKFTKIDEKKIQAQVARPTLSKLTKTISEPPPSRTGFSSGDSSSADEEDEEEEEEQGPTGLKALKPTTPKIKKSAERRQVKMLDDAAVGLKPDQMNRFNRREEARRQAMRLKPDVSPLHRIILSWDYDHPGDVPPSHDSRDRQDNIPDTFQSYDHYRSVFQPLLVLECWAQLVQSKDEPRDHYECKIMSKAFVDDWSDFEFTIAESVKKEWSLGDADIILLKHLGNGKSILAKVQHYRASPQGIQGSLRCYLGNGRPDPGLQANTLWDISRVFSLSTLHREYAALIGLEYYDFLNDILHPRLIAKPDIDTQDVQRAMKTYCVNEPQAKAILGALRTDKFSLIQGPPGTGKTTTICSLVNAFLSSYRAPAPVGIPGRNNAPAEKPVKPKILICAPSNAAIDEVASRLKDQGPNVVRVGADKAINVSVKDISLDGLVDQKLSDNKIGAEAPKEVGNQVAALRRELDGVRSLRQQKEDELSSIHDNMDKTKTLDDEIRRLKQKRLALTQQMDKLKDKQRDSWRTLDGTRRRFRSEVLQEADVICSTLSGSGHELLEQFNSFDMVIIDEAAQSIELSSLIPLKYRIKRCVMVGDPKQLPPTVLSQETRRRGYDQSLFVRLQKQRPGAVHLLSIQYRMHPEISSLPSEVFYFRRLLDGPGMDIKTKQPWHANDMFGPYRFFNVSRGQESSASNGSSLLNRTECQIAAALYNRLQKEFSSINFDFRIGIVSMYRAQIQELRRTFQARFGEDIVRKLDFNTVDGFQGQEKDIIILSCVRATTGGTTVGFLADQRRMNVALTRARSSLFVLGHAPTLERSDDTWRGIVNNARARAHLYDVDVDFFTRPSTMPASAITAPKGLKRKASSEIMPPAELMKPKDLRIALARETSMQNGVQQEVNMEVDQPPTPAEPSSAVPLDIAPDRAVMRVDASNGNTKPQPSASHGATGLAPQTKGPPPQRRSKPSAGGLWIPKPVKRG